MRDPGCLGMTFSVFPELEKKHRNADVLSCFLADERTSADNQAVSTSPPARGRRRKVFSFLAYNLTLVISGTNREGKIGAQTSQ